MCLSAISCNVSEQGTLILGAEDLGESASGVGGMEYKIDDGQWQSYSAPLSVGGWADGEHVVAYRAYDQAGNRETDRELSLLVDSTSPETMAHVEGAEYRSAENVLYLTQATTISLSSSDTLSGVEGTKYRIDGGEWLTYEPFTVSAEGAHLVEYRSVDNLGNLEGTKSLAFVIDNTAPQTSLEFGAPQYADHEGAIYLSSATDCTLSAIDDESGVRDVFYRIDGGAWSAYAPFTIAGEDGHHSISFYAVDRLGNREPEQTIEVVVDNSPPVTTTTVSDPQYASADGTLYVTSASTVSLSADDNLSGVSLTEYRLDDGAWLNYAAAISLAELSNGLHSVSYRSIDRLGNPSEEEAIEVILDNVSPETVLEIENAQFVDDSGSRFATENSVFTLTGADEHSGVAATEYRIDDGEWINYAPFTLGVEGEHRIDYRSADNLGNLESVKTLLVTIDNTAPESFVEIGEPQRQDGDLLYVGAASPITLGASDALVGVAASEYRIDSGAWSRYAGSISLVGLGDGSHIVGYRSVDHLGNLGIEQTLSVGC